MGQTLGYALSEYLYVLVLSYGGSMILLLQRTQKTRFFTQNEPEKLTIIVVFNGGQYTPVAVAEIAYIEAATPYVAIHAAGKKHLHTETLKSLAEKLDAGQFVRIHKSAIVNLHKVRSYKSRLNGDYDITLQDGSQLRLSRNYAANFKEKMSRCPSSGQAKKPSA
ncbi:MAG: LytTR family transcriptional regulator [Cytophagales bacterium]|nr:LytTR family transcriptional regulator [Cytophagales bacterium]